MFRIAKWDGCKSSLVTVWDERQAPWASQFEVVATVVAATTYRVASASFGDFAVAATAGNMGDVGGRRRRTVV